MSQPASQRKTTRRRCRVGLLQWRNCKSRFSVLTSPTSPLGRTISKKRNFCRRESNYLLFPLLLSTPKRGRGVVAPERSRRGAQNSIYRRCVVSKSASNARHASVTLDTGVQMLSLYRCGEVVNSRCRRCIEYV